VNASASALPREDEVQSKIRKIRAFGRNARRVCLALFWLAFVGIVIVLLAIAIRAGILITGAPTGVATRPNIFDGGAYDVLQALLTPLQLLVCVLLVLGVVFALWFATLNQLYLLFGSLAAGAIYTPENVRRVRNVGLLSLLWAVLGVVLPIALVVARALIDASVPMDPDRVLPPLSQVLGAFVTAGLVLLASWIMDVGLYEKDHADALQRDAELTI
jgi:hypothetical protein